MKIVHQVASRCFWPKSWFGFFTATAIFSLLVIFYAEFLNYALLIGIFCRWPTLEGSQNNESGVYRFVIASDTHLFDRDQSNWLDRFRSEFAMQKAYFASFQMLQPRPDATFVLGDLTDDGENAKTRQEVADYKQRFDAIFNPDFCPVYTIFGNHDVGGWGSRRLEPRQLNWFSNEFNSNGLVWVVRFGLVEIVLLNSMAIQGNCSICDKARFEASRLKVKNRPILLQHVPIFRGFQTSKQTDLCPSNLDVLSEETSRFVLDIFQPRLMMCGHVHLHCQTKFNLESRQFVDEVSVEAFAWHKGHTSLTLLVADPDRFSTSQCKLPNEATISAIYQYSCFILMIWLAIRFLTMVILKMTSSGHVLMTQSSVQTEVFDMS